MLASPFLESTADEENPVIDAGAGADAPTALVAATGEAAEEEAEGDNANKWLSPATREDAGRSTARGIQQARQGGQDKNETIEC